MSSRLFFQILFFIVLVGAALAAGALLAYPVHRLLPMVEFSSVAERCSLLCGLIASLLYVRWTMPFSLAAIGYWRPANGLLPALAQSYGAGMLVMAVPVLLLSLLGLSHLDPDESFTLAFFLQALLIGLVAGFGASIIEETLFRGALYSGLEKRTNLLWTVLLSSLLYSAVHFLEYPIPDGDITWLTGLALFPEAIGQMFRPGILSHFLTLFLLGVLLCLLRWRDGHIWRAFGLHAGIVMVIKLHSEIADKTTGTHYDFLVNVYSSRLGWLTTVWLLIILAFYGWHCYRNPAN